MLDCVWLTLPGFMKWPIFSCTGLHGHAEGFGLFSVKFNLCDNVLFMYQSGFHKIWRQSLLCWFSYSQQSCEKYFTPKACKHQKRLNVQIRVWGSHHHRALFIYTNCLYYNGWRFQCGGVLRLPSGRLLALILSKSSYHF